MPRLIASLLVTLFLLALSAVASSAVPAAPAFAQQSRVACHRLVYDALHPFMSQGLHALAIEICP